MTTVQQSYSINPDIGFPGQIAEPNSPMRIQEGRLFVATGDSRQNPRPGDAVYWDNSNDAWRVANAAANQLRISGILTYRADIVASATNFAQYSSGDQIFVVTMGVVWVTAGGTVEQGNQLEFQTDDYKYDSLARVTAIANIVTKPIECFSVSGADNGVIRAAIGYGRVI